MITAERWYSAGEISFQTAQVIWILENLTIFRLGIYPARPNGSGCPDLPLTPKHRTGRGAAFERAGEITAEIELRLKRAGFDGFLLEAVYSWDKSEDELAEVFGMKQREIRRRVSRALKYISGYRRKRCGYKEYIGHRKALVRNA